MKNKAYFIKNLARIKGLPEDDPWITSFHDRQILDILIAIKEAREPQKPIVSYESDDLWDRVTNGTI
jgi:hypothetical protein